MTHDLWLCSKVYYNEHLCRIVPNPDPVQRAFKHANMTIYTMMQGPSEFGISGRLANWDIKDRLKEIKVPTLTVGAKFDTMDPDHMKWMSTQVTEWCLFILPRRQPSCYVG
jgi:proline iminopeptidase